ncbi:MAG: tetratricopeptide repeat protein [Planctomycetota bacterium]|jgi:tetratricopeptide (TPR) repeat protein
MIGSLLAKVAGAVAALAGVLAAVLVVTGAEGWRLPAAVLAHLAAAALAMMSARMRHGAALTPVERDLVLVTALILPGVGPALAWNMLRKPDGTDVENAHEVVEQYLDYVKPRIPEYERTLFTGDFDKDLARKLDAVSYREVLAHGNIDQKRSALTRLAELGEPHHLGLIRRCLEDPEQEIRLYAYGELERLIKGRENAVAKARRATEKEPGDPAALVGLAHAHFELATSGLLDAATAHFHLGVAAEQAKKAQALEENDLQAVLLEALVYANMGDLDRAATRLEELPEELRETPEVSRVMGEVAFRSRDFSRARVEAGRLMMAREALPGYLEALCETPEEEESEEDAEKAEAQGATESEAPAEKDEATDPGATEPETTDPEATEEDEA